MNSASGVFGATLGGYCKNSDGHTATVRPSYLHRLGETAASPCSAEADGRRSRSHHRYNKNISIMFENPKLAAGPWIVLLPVSVSSLGGVVKGGGGAGTEPTFGGFPGTGTASPPCAGAINNRRLIAASAAKRFACFMFKSPRG